MTHNEKLDELDRKLIKCRNLLKLRKQLSSDDINNDDFTVTCKKNWYELISQVDVKEEVQETEDWMKKIEKLTVEQEEALIAYRDEWLAHGRSTEPADRKTSERVFGEMYKLLGKKKPYVWWCDGPAVGSLIRSVAKQGADNNLVASLRASLLDNLRDNLRDNLMDNLMDNLGDNLMDSLRDGLWDSLRDNLWDSLRDNLGASLLDSLRDSLWDSLRDNLWDNLVWGFWSQHEAYWPAYYNWPHEALRKMHSKDQSDKLNLWLDLAKSCGWWEPFEGVVFACERPAKQATDDRGRLHCDDGPAILCRDGWPVYAIHGVMVNADVVERPGTITVEAVEKEKNAEIKRVMIERMGWPKYLRESGAKVVEIRKNDIEGTVESLMSYSGGSVLVCACPSTAKIFSLEVPGGVKTCQEAQNWLSGGLAKRVVSAS